MSAFLVVMALVADAIIGDPDSVWRRIPHPVALFGKLIDWFDRTFNTEDRRPEDRRWSGGMTIVVLVVGCFSVGSLIQATLLFLPFGWAVLILFASTLIAQKSLYQHVDTVRQALNDGGVTAGREAVSRIVGRNPESLDEAAISRAAIESCAENFSDGVVAPAFWFALLGLPGLLAYKAINTADSMIGYRNERYTDFGWAAAKLDDLVNWPPARLSVLFVALAAAMTGHAPMRPVKAALRDAGGHRSPNAGWPEAAFAATLDLSLAGPRTYGSQVVDDAYMNPEGRREAGPKDIARALRLLTAACIAQVVFYLVIVLFI